MSEAVFRFENVVVFQPLIASLGRRAAQARLCAGSGGSASGVRGRAVKLLLVEDDAMLGAAVKRGLERALNCWRTQRRD
jgi:hypothetical protein